MWFFYAFSSAVFSAIAAVTQKNILFKFDAVRFSFFLSVLNLILLSPLFLFYLPPVPETKILLSVVLKSFLSSAAFLYVMKSLKNFEISSALPLLALTPGIVAVMSFLFLGDIISLYGIAGVCLMIAGTYFLESKKGSLFEPFRVFLFGENRKYILLALGIFSLTSVLDRLILWKYKLPPIDFLVYQQILSVIFFSILFFATNKKEKTLSFAGDPKKYIALFLIVSLATLSYRYFQMEAVKLAPAALVLSVKRMSIFMATLVGGKLFNENNLSRKMLATILILAGLVLVQIF